MDDDVVDQARLDDKEQLEKAGEADDQTFTTDVDTVPEKSLMNGKAGEGNNTVKLDADKIYRTIGSTGIEILKMNLVYKIRFGSAHMVQPTAENTVHSVFW